MDALYEQDFREWALDQARRLRQAEAKGSNLDLDWANLIEEVESLGRSERRELHSCLVRVLEHSAKLAYSPAERPRLGWMETVDEHRARLEVLLRDSPSLRRDMPELMDDAWAYARRGAGRGFKRRLELISLPEACPFGPERVLDPDWFPDPPKAA